MTTDNMFQADFLDQTHSTSPTKPNSFIFGLPNPFNCHFMPTKCPLTNPKIGGFFSVQRSRGDIGIIYTSDKKPIVDPNRMSFITEKGEIFTPCGEKILYPDGIISGDKYKLICGGHIATTNGYEYRKCFINPEEGFFLLDDSSKIPFTMCFAAIMFRKIGVFSHDMKMIPLTDTQLFQYSTKPFGFAEITVEENSNQIYSNYQIIIKNMHNLCYPYF